MVSYHERDKPIPAGWQYAGELLGHHALRYVLIEPETSKPRQPVDKG
jgi:hypothetical protein